VTPRGWDRLAQCLLWVTSGLMPCSKQRLYSIAPYRIQGRSHLLRLDQFRLDHAPTFGQALYLGFRRGNNPVREGCEQRRKPFV